MPRARFSAARARCSICVARASAIRALLFGRARECGVIAARLLRLPAPALQRLAACSFQRRGACVADGFCNTALSDACAFARNSSCHDGGCAGMRRRAGSARPLLYRRVDRFFIVLFPFRFAWTCSIVLAADIRASCNFSFRFAPACGSVSGGSLKRGSGAPQGATVFHRVLLREHGTGLRGRFSPDGAPLRCLRRWDPSASPTCHGYCPMALGRRRDGRFHPMLLSEQGGLLHSSPGRTVCETMHAGTAPHSRSVRLENVPQRMGMNPRYSDVTRSASSRIKNYL